MTDEKVLSPEEEKVIAKISGKEVDAEFDPVDPVANIPGVLEVIQQKEATKAAIIEKASEVEEFTIEASEVLVEGTKENQLGADMVKLAGIDSRLNEIKTEQETIRTIIDEYLKTQGLFSPAEKLKTEATSLRKDYGLLKTDIGERALANYEKTGEKKPALGCEIKMFKNREFSVDINKAVQWCIDKDLKVFLGIDRGKYAEQLALGTFPDMPGKVDDSKIPKASISIKPYQVKEK